MNNGNSTTTKTFTYSIVEKIVGSCIVFILLAMVTVYMDVQHLNAFAQEGARFTQEDFESFKTEAVEYRKDIKVELKEIKGEAKQTREALIRMEALLRVQAGLPPR